MNTTKDTTPDYSGNEIQNLVDAMSLRDDQSEGQFMSQVSVSTYQDSNNPEQIVPSHNEYVIYEVKNDTELFAIYHQVQDIPIEKGLKPGQVSALTFAKQVRTQQFEDAHTRLTKNKVAYLYAGTVAAKPDSWVPWIRGICNEFNNWVSKSDHDYLAREESPMQVTEYRENQEFRQGMISPPEITIPQSLTTQTYMPGTHVVRATLSSMNPQPNSPLRTTNPFIQDDEGDEYDERTEVLSAKSDQMRIHSRSTDYQLSPIHKRLNLKVVFTDLHLNLLNAIHNEYESLVSTSSNITGLTLERDTNTERAFKLLKLFARSTQPPFKVDETSATLPAIHLEFFHHALISNSGTIRSVQYALKHYTKGEILTPLRYEYFISSVSKERAMIYQLQGVGGNSQTRSNRIMSDIASSRTFDLFSLRQSAMSE